MIKILGEYYDLDLFINKFVEKDFRFKYDGLREEKQYTLTGRNDINAYDWQNIGDTDQPFIAIHSLFERLGIVDYEEYIRFLKHIVPYLINKHGENNIIIITNKEQKIWVIVSDNKNSILDFQGDVEMLAKVLNDKDE